MPGTVLSAIPLFGCAIPENDIVCKTNKPSSQLLAPVSLRLSNCILPMLVRFFILLLDALHQESTSGYEFRQELMSP